MCVIEDNLQKIQKCGPQLCLQLFNYKTNLSCNFAISSPWASLSQPKGYMQPTGHSMPKVDLVFGIFAGICTIRCRVRGPKKWRGNECIVYLSSDISNSFWTAIYLYLFI